MDFYRYILDIQSLDSVIKRYLDQTQEEKSRIDFLEKQRNQRKEKNSELENKKTEYKTRVSDLEKELFGIDEKISKSKEHMALASSQAQVDALTKEIETLSPRQSEIEEEVLTILDQIEEIDSLLEIDTEYFGGIQETIDEVNKEISEIEDGNKEEVSKLETQIEGLILEIPSDFLVMYKNVREKFRFQEPVTKLTGCACGKCRMQISTGEASEINNSFQHRICAGCGRILISNKVA